MDLKAFLENFDTIAEAPGGIAKLKALILDLAVRGKLVSQNPKDEPVFELIEKIRVTKNQLIKDKKIPKEKNFASVENPDSPFEIPSTWMWVKLGEISKYFEYGTSEKSSAGKGDVPVFRMNNIQDGKLIFENLKYVSQSIKDLPKLYLQDGDLLFNRTNSYELVGKTGLFRGESNRYTFASYLIRAVLFLEYTNPELICLAINSNYFRQTQIEPEIVQQCGQANFNGTKLQNTLIPLPPLAEQKRIVEKVDELMALCDRLAAAKQTRDALRQKLRGSAISALMNAETDEALEKSWAIVRDNWHTLSQDPKDVDELRRSVLQLAVRGKLVRHTNSFKKPLKKFLSFQNGYAFKSEWYEPKGMRLVRNQNIGHGNLRWEEVKYIDPQKAEEFKRFALREGDTVISLDRPIINTGLKIARIKAEDVPSLLLQRVARPFFKDDSLSPDYFFMWLNSPEFTRAIDPGRSNGVPHISTGALENIEILVPPLAEQKRIVAKVDELMQMCDQLEASLRQSQQRASALAASAISHLTI